jgi:hypothetical protein
MWQRVGDHHRRRRRDVGSALKGVWIFLGERGRGGLHSLSPCAQPGISKRLPAEGDGRVVFCLAEEGGASSSSVPGAWWSALPSSRRRECSEVRLDLSLRVSILP